MDIVRQSLAITFVFALLWLALWLLRRRGALRIQFPRGRAVPGLLESRARLSLSPQHSVHVVRAGKRELVVAAHPSGVTLLCELAAGDVNPAPEPTL
jgi:flagellar biogenesis protein FliO